MQSPWLLSLQRLPLADASVDVVLCSNGLQYLTHPVSSAAICYEPVHEHEIDVGLLMLLSHDWSKVTLLATRSLLTLV